MIYVRLLNERDAQVCEPWRVMERVQVSHMRFAL
jgi:hypothetical protein